MEEMWLARDENGSLYFFVYSKPKKYTREGMWISDNYNHYPINKDLFHEVQWSDEEPTKVKLVIDKQYDKGNTTKYTITNIEID